MGGFYASFYIVRRSRKVGGRILCLLSVFFFLFSFFLHIFFILVETECIGHHLISSSFYDHKLIDLSPLDFYSFFLFFFSFFFFISFILVETECIGCNPISSSLFNYNLGSVTLDLYQSFFAFYFFFSYRFHSC